MDDTCAALRQQPLVRHRVHKHDVLARVVQQVLLLHWVQQLLHVLLVHLGPPAQNHAVALAAVECFDGQPAHLCPMSIAQGAPSYVYRRRRALAQELRERGWYLVNLGAVRLAIQKLVAHDVVRNGLRIVGWLGSEEMARVAVDDCRLRQLVPKPLNDVLEPLLGLAPRHFHAHNLVNALGLGCVLQFNGLQHSNVARHVRLLREELREAIEQALPELLSSPLEWVRPSLRVLRRRKMFHVQEARRVAHGRT
mmetsp:Transcript_11230/g.41116  ORF Transcript_11230/g.41116 Transcript_11230/m.41116 type:complete len:252 (+) Transcript_11230:461-1216(+)